MQPPTLACGSSEAVHFGRPSLKHDQVIQKGGLAVYVRARIASSPLRVLSFSWGLRLLSPSGVVCDL